MTKDEKIAYYNKIEQALNIEYPVMHEGMTETQIRSLIANLSDESVTVDDLEPLTVGKVKEANIDYFKHLGLLYGENNLLVETSNNHNISVYDR